MRWKPDTCGCYFEYDFNTNGTVRTSEQFTNVTVIKSCPRHSGGANPMAVKMSAIQDNWLRNDARQIISSVMGKENVQGYEKKMVDRFGEDGKLYFSVEDQDVNPTKEREIQESLNLQLGTGKVTIE